MLKSRLGTRVCQNVSRWFPLAPELLDLVFWLERSFGVKLDRKEFLRVFGQREPVDFTAGELHDWVCEEIWRKGKTVPFSSWHRVQRVLFDLTGKLPQSIRRGSYIDRDLGYFEGG